MAHLASSEREALGLLIIPLRHSDLGEAFWELTGFGFVGTPKLSELEARAIPGWVTTLGSCSVSSQEQIREGGVGPAQSGQYHAWNSEVKRVGGWSNPRMGDHPGKLLRELPETKPCVLARDKSLRAQSWVPKRTISCLVEFGSSPLRHSDLGEAFWELTGFGFVGTPKLSEFEARAIPGWVTTLGSCSVSSQEQIREGGRRPSPERTISCYGGAGTGRDN
ncbi:hypothetical protein L3X38_044661 [Prunus dulcis]|uniref:Uncharacterized protein n=1 Tax=Prunus dulcis TaxID=3755 RepID=A0AAD4UZ19_PRUDU|nr:hypothetical protein L3X38_044661 [Prunus dulcis]